MLPLVMMLATMRPARRHDVAMSQFIDAFLSKTCAAIRSPSADNQKLHAGMTHVFASGTLTQIASLSNTVDRRMALTLYSLLC